MHLVNNRTAGLSLWLAVFWIASASAQQVGAEDAVLGKMGDVEIKTSEMRRIIDAQPPEVRKQITGASGELDRLVRSELVRQSLLSEARSRGWEKKPDVALMIERAKEQALLQIYMSDLARPPAGYPSEDEVRRAYEANKSAFAVPGEFYLAQIFVSSPRDADQQTAAAAQKKAAELAARARANGVDFAKLAKENSEHMDTAPKGGDMGWLPAPQLLPEIRAAVEKMTKGDISAPIRTDSGWHVVKLVDRKPASTRSLSEVQDAIVGQLRVRRAQEFERSYIEGMVSRTQPSVNQAELAKLQSAK
jgi:peptidylprolyl isomerase